MGDCHDNYIAFDVNIGGSVDGVVATICTVCGEWVVVRILTHGDQKVRD
jgi:hypothetical protein